MKRLSYILLFLLLFASCNSDEADTPNPQSTDTPTVTQTAAYNVTVIDGVTYAEGLSHETLNSTESSVIPLLLDIYQPDNDSENHPAMVLIHGGGFVGGSRKDPNITNLANYFASRGWVVFSINYRLRGDLGTVPSQWIQYVQDNLEPSQVSTFLSVYAANRDAKAAIRWVVANAASYNINTDYLTVGGGSAGAIIAITASVSNAEDYRDEISASIDPTLSSTNRNTTYQVHTILNFWGSSVGIEALEEIYGHQRFDSQDAPIIIMHGTEDATVEYSEALELQSIYNTLDLDYQLYSLEGSGHGAWNATVDGKRLEELSFDFIVAQQNLIVK